MADSTTTVRTSRNSRSIFGFMAFAMLFSVVGVELKKAGGAKTTGVLEDPVAIFLGGTVATAILVLLADTGDTGRTLGVGLAGVTLATAALVNGAPVWKGIEKLTGASPTGTGTGATTPTTPAGQVAASTPATVVIQS